MTKRANDLKKICENYIDGLIDTSEYRDTFNEYYIQYEDEMNDGELAMFDSIYIANELYQPDEEIRRTEQVYIDENELRNTVKSSLLLD